MTFRNSFFSQAFASPDTMSLESRLARVRRLAWILDAAIRVPGTQFRLGLDAVIGLIPGLGNLVMGLISLYIVWEARQMGAPPAVLGRMLVNVVVETLVDTVPVVGDIADAAFKANLRNVALLEQYLATRRR